MLYKHVFTPKCKMIFQIENFMSTSETNSDTELLNVTDLEPIALESQNHPFPRNSGLAVADGTSIVCYS